jgi:hypothetical protein
VRSVVRKAAGDAPAPAAAPAPALDRAALDAACARVLKALDAADVPPSVVVTVEVSTAPAAPAPAPEPVRTFKALITKADEERVVIGVVLEPTKEMNQPDTQGDVYSADEVKKSAYNYMERHQTVGLQHKSDITEKVKVILNWITLEDSTIGGQPVAKGTWVMGVRVTDDDLWTAVKAGSITGFSIGGVATRTPAGVQ